MYAIMEVNGTQVKVEKNDTITINRLREQSKKTFKVKEVLFGKKGTTYYVGTPYVKNAFIE